MPIRSVGDSIRIHLSEGFVAPLLKRSQIAAHRFTDKLLCIESSPEGREKIQKLSHWNHGHTIKTTRGRLLRDGAQSSPRSKTHRLDPVPTSLLCSSPHIPGRHNSHYR
ncbi:unnamed protein product [Mycena citricolor]|uniref:Uncharacterized protein n=1 Tax=Mycena citricolor TaxID=2018698 RepID=A0AAD2H0G2_9AGAR|nr:unnamed protein product [Mycena citricolor]CAK5282594.1 unnamed protein product [Mycena citricolor]CAK5282607.1 unnamed protein product [Mycena citricolor]